MQAIYINGRKTDQLAVTDRAFQYGDGLFETMAALDGELPLLPLHLQRLQRGLQALKFVDVDLDGIQQACRRHAAEIGTGVVKLMLTRGSAQRGYRLAVQQDVTQVIMLQELPSVPVHYWQDGIQLKLCQFRLAHQPALAGIKHLNRLEQVLAASELTQNDIEALVCDMHNNIIEGLFHNIFWVRDNKLYTPDLGNCGIAGVMRAYIIKIAQQQGFFGAEQALCVDELTGIDELFLCNSIHGIWPVNMLEQYSYPIGQVTRQLQEKVNVVVPYNNVSFSG